MLLHFLNFEQEKSGSTTIGEPMAPHDVTHVCRLSAASSINKISCPNVTARFASLHLVTFLYALNFKDPKRNEVIHFFLTSFFQD